MSLLMLMQLVNGRFDYYSLGGSIQRNRLSMTRTSSAITPLGSQQNRALAWHTVMYPPIDLLEGPTSTTRAVPVASGAEKEEKGKEFIKWRQARLVLPLLPRTFHAHPLMEYFLLLPWPQPVPTNIMRSSQCSVNNEILEFSTVPIRSELELTGGRSERVSDWVSELAPAPALSCCSAPLSSSMQPSPILSEITVTIKARLKSRNGLLE